MSNKNTEHPAVQVESPQRRLLFWTNPKSHKCSLGHMYLFWHKESYL